MVDLVLLAVAVLGLITSTVYLGMVLAAARRFRRRRKLAPGAQLAPVTLLKPVHGMEPRLRENLESFFQQNYPAYQIVFGARNEQDAAVPVIREIAARHPHVPIQIVLSGEPAWPNAKLYNLHHMMSAAAHDYLVISDSDVHVAPTYIREVIAPLLDPAVGMVTCLYRGVATGGFWSGLEALGMSVEMSSGVLVAEMLEGMKFALGPTMALRRDCLEAVGGFSALRDYLADDFVLGNRIHAARYEVVLSEHVIDHVVVNRWFFSSMQHQVRWAKSTRRSRPKGHVGTGLTFAVPFGILGFVSAAIRGDAVLGTALLAIAILNRVVQCWAVGWGVVRDERARKLTWLYPLRDLLGFGFWAASFVGGRRTKWRGDSYIIREEGRMERVGGERVARRTTA